MPLTQSNDYVMDYLLDSPLHDSRPSLLVTFLQMSTIHVFVTLGGGQPVIVDIRRDAFVGHLVKAVIAELRLDVTADMVLLRLAPSGAGGYGVALNPRKTLSEAGVDERSDLLVELNYASRVGACRRGELSFVGLPSEGIATGGCNHGCMNERLLGRDSKDLGQVAPDQRS